MKHTLLSVLFLVAGIAAQDPVVSIPTTQGAWVINSDGSADLLELSDGKLVIRQSIVVSPQVLHAEWTDRTNTKHAIDTNCANITIEECLRRHLEALTKYQAAFPPA